MGCARGGGVSSAGVVPLRNIPDVNGLVGRRDSATESPRSSGQRPPQYPSACSGLPGLDQNFHDVTIVDMGDLP